MSGYTYRGDPALIALNAAIMAARPAPDRPKYGRGEAPHGTPAGYRRHVRHREKACAPCLAAELRRQRERKQARRAA